VHGVIHLFLHTSPWYGAELTRERIFSGLVPVQCHFVHHKSPCSDLDSNQGHHGGKPATNRLNYGTALVMGFDASVVSPSGYVVTGLYSPFAETRESS
jgi:hypothetical protein